MQLDAELKGQGAVSNATQFGNGCSADSKRKRLELCSVSQNWPLLHTGSVGAGFSTDRLCLAINGRFLVMQLPQPGVASLFSLGREDGIEEGAASRVARAAALTWTAQLLCMPQRGSSKNKHTTPSMPDAAAKSSGHIKLGECFKH